MKHECFAKHFNVTGPRPLRHPPPWQLWNFWPLWLGYTDLESGFRIRVSEKGFPTPIGGIWKKIPTHRTIKTNKKMDGCWWTVKKINIRIWIRILGRSASSIGRLYSCMWFIFSSCSIVCYSVWGHCSIVCYSVWGHCSIVCYNVWGHLEEYLRKKLSPTVLILHHCKWLWKFNRGTVFEAFSLICIKRDLRY